MIKVFAIAASEFAVPVAQPILRQLIKFALLKGIKVGILIENDAEQATVNTTLGDHANQIIMLKPDNQSNKHQLANASGGEIFSKGKNLELLSLLAEVSPQSEQIPASDYPSVLFLTVNRDDALAASSANFKSVLRPPARPNASLNLGYLQEVSTQFEVQATADNPFTQDDLKQCATSLINEFNRINGISSTPTNAGDNGFQGGTAVPELISSQLSAVTPQIKALAFSYKSIAGDIARSQGKPYLPLLLIELALRLRLPVSIIKSQETPIDSNFENELARIKTRIGNLAADQPLIVASDTSEHLGELIWSTQAREASDISGASTSQAANIYFVSSNKERVDEVKDKGFSAIFCQNNPNQELQPVVQALTNITNSSTSDFIIGKLIGTINQLLTAPSASTARRSALIPNSRHVRWANDNSEIRGHDDNDQRRVTTDDHDVVTQLPNTNNEQTVTHSRAWVAGFFAASTLGGAAGAGVAQYLTPENLVSDEARAALIASCSATGAGVGGIAYWGISNLVQMCCQATQISDDVNDKSPLLGGGVAQFGPF